MPKCQNCNHEISSFDKDICPYCGAKNPISSDYRTMDETGDIRTLEGYDLPKSKSHLACAVLSILLGFVGSDFFYLGYKKNGVFAIGVSVVLFLAPFLGLFLGMGNLLLGLIIGIALMYLPGIVRGFLYLIKGNTMKDAKGELLR